MHRLKPDEADDFRQTVHLRLLARNYDLFAQFAGRSSLKTYLTVAVVRILLDWRNALYGKWRPSRAAVQLGTSAVALEKLISRDGHSRQVAVAMLCGDDDRADLLDLATRLPVRVRWRLLSDERLVDVPDPHAPVDGVSQEENRREQRRLRQALRMAVRSLPDHDRTLLHVRFVAKESLRAFGHRRRIPPKDLYGRLQKVLRRLRQELSGRGFTRLPEAD
jgi:RNA polymerase sigma factor (sigma-70 family)